MNHPNLLVTEKVKHLGVNIQRKIKKSQFQHSTSHGLLHLIYDPPPSAVEDFTFLHPRKISIKYGFTPEEYGSYPEEFL